MSLSKHDLPRQNVNLSIEGVGDNVTELVDELGRFVASSDHLIGVTVASQAPDNQFAFAGGHTTEHRDNYGTMSVSVGVDEEIRDATKLLVSDERLAELTGAYVLPEHLKDPANHVDAYIGFIIKKLVGYQEEADDVKAFAEQAIESALPVMVTPGATINQITAFALHGEVNVGSAQNNALHRTEQVETLEHVLRFLIARELNKPYTNGEFYAGIDYSWGTGLMGEALAIVNGINGFNEDPDPTTNDLLYRGQLAQKSSIAYKDDTVLFSGARGPEPIWPPEKVTAYQEERRAAAEARAQQTLADQAQRQARLAERAQRLADEQAELRQVMGTLADGGYEWRGIMNITPGTPMDSVDKVRAYYAEKYGASPEDVYIVEDAEILAGTKPQKATGRVTIYTRNS